jgi:hypothetical protein
MTLVEAKRTCALQIPSFLQTVNNAHFKLTFTGYNEEANNCRTSGNAVFPGSVCRTKKKIPMPSQFALEQMLSP